MAETVAETVHAASLSASLASMLIAPVLEAGRLQLQIRAAGAAVSHKRDASPVTEADQRSEAVITAALGQLAPGVPVVAEEAMDDGPCPIEADPDCMFFLVDPLDGTREFVDGGDDFTINIALIARGRPCFGLVYAPALGELYVTLGPDRAVTAFVGRQCTATSLADLETAPLRVRRLPPAGERTAMVSRRDTAGCEDERLLAVLGVARCAPIGSSLKFCRIARGDGDVYPRLTSISEWDIAAGHAVLAASGGSVRTLAMQEIRYGMNAPTFRAPGFVAAGCLEPLLSATDSAGFADTCRRNSAVEP